MKIKIDNRELAAFEGETVIEAARRNGIEVPALCYASGYQHQPSCMVCMVKNSQTGQMIPSCSTLVAEDMVLDSESDEVTALRRQSLELLLSDHVAACRPPCDVNHCLLRKYAISCRAKWNRFPRYSSIEATAPQHISANFWFDAAKCIKCGLCVYNTTDGFTFKNRGFGMEVVLPQESVGHVHEWLCGICPTCALYVTK